MEETVFCDAATHDPLKKRTPILSAMCILHSKAIEGYSLQVFSHLKVQLRAGMAVLALNESDPKTRERLKGKLRRASWLPFSSYYWTDVPAPP